MDRLWIALAVNSVFAVIGVRAGALDWSGAVAGIVCGTTASVAFGWQGFGLIALFAGAGFVVTKVGYAQKARRHIAQSRGGRRGWINVLANCAAPTMCAIAVVTFAGRTDITNGLSFGAGFAASIACALGDTVATELGQLSRGKCYLLPTMHRVRAGTPGGVSWVGSMCGILAITWTLAAAQSLGILPTERNVITFLAAVGAFFTESFLHRIERIQQHGEWLPNLMATSGAAVIGILPI